MLLRVVRRAQGRGRLLAILPVVVVLGLGACSSDDDEPAGSATTASTPEDGQPEVQEYDVPAGSHPHDVAVADDGTVWYTAQATGKLGRLDPATGKVTEVELGDGSSPHGVIMGPDGAPWITDTGLNAIVHVDPRTSAVRRFEAPAGRRVGMHTAAFDQKGVLWFTGSDGFYGRLDPTSEPPAMKVYDAPRGAGPYGITVAPNGDVYFASLGQSYLARVDPATGAATVIEPPTRGQGTRRAWSDSRGIIWSSQWNAGQIASYEPATGEWKERRLPGDRPQAYAIYVDERDIVWASDFGANSIVRFDPRTEEFTEFPLPSPNGSVRQLLGRPGEVWGAESSVDKLIVIRTG